MTGMQQFVLNCVRRQAVSCVVLCQEGKRCGVTLIYKGSLRPSSIRVVLSSHTGLRFLLMILLLNTSLPLSLNFTQGSLVPMEGTMQLLETTTKNNKQGKKITITPPLPSGLPQRARPQKHTTSLLALALGLPSLVGDFKQAQISALAECAQVSRQVDRQGCRTDRQVDSQARRHSYQIFCRDAKRMSTDIKTLLR